MTFMCLIRPPKMLYLLVISTLVSQIFTGSAYVLVERNGYYTTLRSNPIEPQMTQWPSVLSPQYYMPFWQNLNPFYWTQPQQPMIQDNMELDILRENQRAMLNIIRCLLEEDKKEICKKMFRNTMMSTQQSMQIPEITIIKPAEMMQIQSVEIKPVPEPLIKPIDVEISVSSTELEPMKPKLPMLEVKSGEIESTTLEVKPLMTETMHDKLMDVKPMEPVSIKSEMPMMEIKDMKVEQKPMPSMEESPDMQDKPMETKPLTAMETEPMKPQPMMEVKPSEQPMEPMDMKAVASMAPALPMMEIKDMKDEKTPMVEPAVTEVKIEPTVP